MIDLQLACCNCVPGWRWPLVLCCLLHIGLANNDSNLEFLVEGPEMYTTSNAHIASLMMIWLEADLSSS